MIVHPLITRTEAHTLVNMIMDDIPYLMEEIGHLEVMPKTVRDLCYGPTALESTYGVRDDVLLLLDLAVSGQIVPLPKGSTDGIRQTVQP